jgi:Tfp pilus assembly protein FimT
MRERRKMRYVVLLCVLVGMAAPLEAQKIKRSRDRILVEELATFGELTVTEVINQARPHFFQPEPTQIDIGLRAPWRLLVYIGSQVKGDSSVLRLYKASEIQEIRWLKPNEANIRLGAENASVIQLTFKDSRRSS